MGRLKLPMATASQDSTGVLYYLKFDSLETELYHIPLSDSFTVQAKVQSLMMKVLPLGTHSNLPRPFVSQPRAFRISKLGATQDYSFAVRNPWPADPIFRFSRESFARLLECSKGSLGHPGK